MNLLIRAAVGALIGAAVGFAMYRYVGCKTGACPITASPYTSVLIYGLLGAFVAAGK
ncbi:MAG: YtxH domain-containing protein [Kiritimatiellae bacterium]|nr:YtxH domain-containing protein [Kiritimatiellia bacterium]